MKTYRIQLYVAKEKEIFVGLEDSKRTWKLAVRCEKMVIHQTSMDAKYPHLWCFAARHQGQCNMAFLDGHVKGMLLTEIANNIDANARFTYFDKFYQGK